MNKTNKKIKLEQTTVGSPSVNSGGHIDLALGTFDRPGPNPGEKQDTAIVPSEMVATQLATSRPPIDDDDYVPSSVSELAKAASEIAKLIPSDQVKKFYLKLKEVADDYQERQEIAVMDGNNMQESKFRKGLVKMIKEAIDDLEDQIPGIDPNRALVGYPDVIKAHPEEFKDVKPERKYAAARIADKVGRAKLMAIIGNIPEKEIDKLHSVAKDEYIDLLEDIAGDDLDASDIQDLKSLSPLDLYETSDSYKFFFKAAFVLPVLDEVQKSFRKIDATLISDIETKLKAIKLPDSAMSSAVFQVVGGVERNFPEIKKRIDAAAAKGEINDRDVDATFKRFTTKYAELASYATKKKTELRGAAVKEFMDASLKRYSSMSLDQRKQILTQALQKMG